MVIYIFLKFAATKFTFFDFINSDLYIFNIIILKLQLILCFSSNFDRLWLYKKYNCFGHSILGYRVVMALVPTHKDDRKLICNSYLSRRLH